MNGDIADDVQIKGAELYCGVAVRFRAEFPNFSQFTTVVR